MAIFIPHPAQAGVRRNAVFQANKHSDILFWTSMNHHKN